MRVWTRHTSPPATTSIADQLNLLRQVLRERHDMHLYCSGLSATKKSADAIDSNSVAIAMREIPRIFNVSPGILESTESRTGTEIVNKWRAYMYRDHQVLLHGEFIAACMLLRVEYREVKEPSCVFALTPR